MRALSLVLACVLAAFPALACDLSLKARPGQVAGYVEAARACLAAPPVGFAFDSDLEADFLKLVNTERAAYGLNPVAARVDLAAPARFHSLDMAVNGFFGHAGPDGRVPDARIASLDRRVFAEFSAENVATLSREGGTLGAKFALKRLHENLMNSPGHRENILHPKATHAAFGVVRTKSGVWVTQLFLGVSGTLVEEAPLRLPPEPSLRVPAVQKDWKFVRFDTLSVAGEQFAVRGVPASVADARLSIYATQPGDRANEFYFIRFLGPAFTVQR